MFSQVAAAIHTFLYPWKKLAMTEARRLRFKWTLPLLGVLFLLGSNVITSSTAVIPTISVTGVVTDDTVTIRTHNFPANQTFTVRMGEMGTLAVGGIVVGTTQSGAGGSFTATYDIPAQLQGRHRIALRLESPQGYFSYNWFNNSTAPSAPDSRPPHAGTPTFRIQSVEKGQSVTIVTHNFPPNQTFTVRMGLMGTLGISGQVVGTIESGAGGQLTQTFTIPESLRGQQRVSIRAQTGHAHNPYFAYNWFDNADAPSSPGSGEGTGTGGGTVTGYTGTPTFRVCTVTRDGDITIQTRNFPANQTFRVTMGPMFSQGIGGTQVGTIESGAGDTARHTFTVPSNLHGSSRIAIRTQTGHTNPFFAYNWFHNTTTISDLCN
jgi:hypothetical protein